MPNVFLLSEWFATVLSMVALYWFLSSLK